MEHIVDPQADYVFDAVSVDVGPKGVVETTPTTDEDWTRIERGAVGARRVVEPPQDAAQDGARRVKRPGGAGRRPSSRRAQIEAKVKANPALWNSHADRCAPRR